jgi:ABC-type multidrug transport system permease subunit
VSFIVKKPEAAPGVIWMLLIPMVTFSGGYVPLELLAPKLVPYVAWIPTRIVVNLFQDLMVNAVSLLNPAILLQFLWLTLESLLLFVIGMKTYRRFAQSS